VDDVFYGKKDFIFKVLLARWGSNREPRLNDLGSLEDKKMGESFLCP